MMNCKAFWKEVAVAYFRVLSQYLHRGTEENPSRKSQDNQRLGWKLNQKSPIYEASVLSTQLWRSVIYLKVVESIGILLWDE
jgi:hypothetical protein